MVGICRSLASEATTLYRNDYAKATAVELIFDGHLQPRFLYFLFANVKKKIKVKELLLTGFELWTFEIINNASEIYNNPSVLLTANEWILTVDLTNYKLQFC